MTQITIPGQIVNGQLQHEQSLARLEGKHVIATLTVVPAESENGMESPVTPEKGAGTAEFDPEPPPWLEVENDVYFRMTAPSIPLGKVKIRVEEGKPRIILPEELPDD